MEYSSDNSSSNKLPPKSSADNTYYSSNPIELSDEELTRISQEPPVSDYVKSKLEKDAKKNWDLFYKRNGDRFFKYRYWTKREFEELFTSDQEKINPDKRYLLEIGCGCGDFALPLIESNCKLFIYCCDFSDKAIEILTSNDIYKQHQGKHVQAFVADVTVKGQLNVGLNSNPVDIVSMIFVLSALTPSKMRDALRNVYEVMKPGGDVLFRDYALHDFAMLRFKSGHKIEENFYFRQDGTRAYFFDKEMVSNIFMECGFHVVTIEYVRRQTINIGENLSASRVFIQGKFKKPVI